MKIEAKVQKWGNGLAIRIAGVMRDIPNFQEGSRVEVDVTEDGLIIKKLDRTNKFRFPFSESELLEGMTPQSVHADLLANPLDDEF